MKKNLPNNLHDEVVKVRRDLHKIPETAFNEFETSDYIKNYLKINNINYESDIAKTGILVELAGKKDGKNVLALRADIDGLPIREETDLEFKSKNGNMHACGHDGHIAMMLVSLKYLNLNKENLSGKLKVIFQPAEEEVGGAKAMIEQRPEFFKDLTHIFGFHIWNQIELGKIAFNDNTVFVSADTFEIEVIGKGGHGAMPHLNVDPVFIAANLIISAQSIISRKKNPGKLGVITFGKIEAGTAANITPEKVKLTGTIRAESKETREFLINELKNLSENFPKSFGGKGKFTKSSGTGPVINNKEFANQSYSIADEIFGYNSSIKVDPVSVADDMAEFMEFAPSVYALLGGKKENSEMHHNSKFDFDEKCMSYGIEFINSLASKILN